MALAAVKGQARSQRMFTALLQATEKERKTEHDLTLETAIEYKTQWEDELERRTALGIVVRHLFLQFFQFAYSHETFVLAIPKPVPLYFFLLGHRPRYVNLPSFHVDNDVVWMPSGASVSLTSVLDDNNALSRSSTSASISPADTRNPPAKSGAET